MEKPDEGESILPSSSRTPNPVAPPCSDTGPRWRTAAVAAAVFASFFAYSLIQAPVPAPNEPQYLCKAKHYWDPAFCVGDFFLDSSYPHVVFYQTVGALTLVLSLGQTAWVGRILGYALLAFGWTRLVSKIRPGTLDPLWAAWVYLAVVTVGNLSGEWIVGGIEAKIFSYGFLFWGLAAIADRRWKTAGLLGGLAVSFHPVVGGWGLIAAAMSGAMTWIRKKFRSQHAVPSQDPASAPLVGLTRQHAIALGLLAACSLPGLVPAVQMLVGKQGGDVAKANRIQVYERLGHHLDPTQFEQTEWNGYEIHAALIGYGFLALFWLAARTRLPRADFERWFSGFVLSAGMIAIAGLLIGWMPHPDRLQPASGTPLLDVRTALLKFYPFRLADAVVPLAVAVVFVGLLEKTGGIEREGSPLPPSSTFRRSAVNGAMFAGFLAFALLRPIPDRNPSHMRPDELQDWIAACRWIDENAPPDAQVLTPSSSWAFKWYARRAEFVSYKDCPQDAAGILEWKDRLDYVDKWSRTNWDPETGYPAAAFRQLRKERRITHLVVYEGVRDSIPFPPVYPPDPDQKTEFAVYRLRDAEAGADSMGR